MDGKQEASESTTLKDQVLGVGQGITQAVAKARLNKDFELRKILDEASSEKFEKINELFTRKDEEIAKLRDEIRKLKTKEFVSQSDKLEIVDQELKKWMKLEFFLQETRSQARKLERMGEQSDKALKELKGQLYTKQKKGGLGTEKLHFWEKKSFWFSFDIGLVVVMPSLFVFAWHRILASK